MIEFSFSHNENEINGKKLTINYNEFYKDSGKIDIFETFITNVILCSYCCLNEV